MSGDGRDPEFDLAGRGIVIAGAAGGLGAPLARALHARGVRLFLLDFDADAAAALAGELGAGWAQADVCDEGSVRAAMAAAGERLGGLDGVLNAAGLLRIAPALEHDVDEFRRSLDVNVTGAFLLSRAAAALMRDGGGGVGNGGNGGGAMVHIASVSSLVANPDYASYASSKAALAQLVRVLAREWAADGIRVNAVGPAMTVTPMNAGYLAEPGFRARALSVIPMGRFGEPDDLVGPVVMLLSAASRFITGQTIYVDGGRTLV